MKIHLDNNWNREDLFFTKFNLINISYEEMNLTSYAQCSLTLALLGFEATIFWNKTFM